MTSFYDLSAHTLDGQPFAFEQLRGKRVLIVNTASACGFTPQYEALQSLHEAHGGEDFVILGFPCNGFGKQEPGDAAEIQSFCSVNYGVTFQMMEKVVIKKDGRHPVYQWLLEKELNGVEKHSVRWNFHKFLVDEQGQIVASLASGEDPMGETITEFASR